jgi:hypothetical protein
MSIWIDARMPLLVTAAGRKARELSLSADKNSFAAQKNTAKKKLIRKNVAKKIVENYRQASGGGHLRPIRA